MQESKLFANEAVVGLGLEGLYPKLFSVPPVACVAFDQTGQVLWSNGRMEGWFDADAETLGPWFQNTWVLQDKALQEARVAQIQGSKGVLKATWLHQHLDQEVGHRLAWTWVADQERDCVYALACDVTRAWLVRQKHHEQFKALKQGQLLAKQGYEQMTKLADVLGHELRNPLHALMGLLEHLPAEGNERFSSLKKGALKNVELMHAFLAKLDSSDKVMAFDTVGDGGLIDVGKIIMDGVSLYREQARQASIALNVAPELPAEGHLLAYGVSSIAQRILLSLISNALKFTPAGGSIELRWQMSDDQVQIQVVDSGRGFDNKMMARLFDKGDASTPVSVVEGGLGVSQRLCALTHGSLEGHSDGAGRGATFTYSLPTRPLAGTLLEGRKQLRPARFERHEASDPPALASLRVLVADDDTAVRRVLRRQLRGVVSEVKWVADGQKAVEAYQLAHESGRPFQFLLFDIHMPEMNGDEALEVIRDFERSHDVTPVTAMALSGDVAAVNDPQQRLFEAGFQHAITKPCKQAELVAGMQEALSWPMGRVDDAELGISSERAVEPIFQEPPSDSSPEVSLSSGIEGLILKPARDVELEGLTIDPELAKRFLVLFPDVLCLVSLEGRFLWTKGLAGHLGWSEEELLEKPFYEVIDESDREKSAEALAKLSHGQPNFHMINRNVCKDGGRVSIAWWSSIDRESGRVFAYGRDVTEEQRLEAKAEALLHKQFTIEARAGVMGACAKQVSQTLQAVLRDVRNCLVPLVHDVTALRHEAETLRLEALADECVQLEPLLEQMHQAIHRLLSVRSGMPAVRVQVEEVDLWALCHQVKSQLDPLLVREGITLTATSLPGAIRWVGDKRLVKDIWVCMLHQLVGRCREASFSLARQDDGVEFRVSYRGLAPFIGRKGALFDAVQRLGDVDLKARFLEGMKITLPMAQSYATTLGGKLSLEHGGDDCHHFILRVPLDCSADASPAAFSEEGVAAVASSGAVLSTLHRHCLALGLPEPIDFHDVDALMASVPSLRYAFVEVVGEGAGIQRLQALKPELTVIGLVKHDASTLLSMLGKRVLTLPVSLEAMQRCLAITPFRGLKATVESDGGGGGGGGEPSLGLVARRPAGLFSEDLTRDLLFRPPVSVLVFDLLGKLVWSNGRIEAWLGGEETTPWLVGKLKVSDRLKQRQALERLVRDDTTLTETWRFYTQSGDLLALVWTLSSVPDDGLVYAMVVDGSEAMLQQQQHEAALAGLRLQQGRELESARQRLHVMDLMRVMNHNLRHPLQTFVGFDGLARRLCLDWPEGLSVVGRAKQTLKQLVHLLDDMNDFDGDDAFVAGRIGPFDLISLVKRILGIYQSRAEGKGIDLVLATHPPGLETLLVVTYSSRVERVLLNLLSNAMKFTERGCVVVTIEAPSDRAQVTVTDTGCGFEPDQAERLFRKFEVGEGVTKLPSSGLGLANCVEMVGPLKGTLTARSVGVGQGASFTFAFARRLAVDPGVVGEAKEAPAETIRRPLRFADVRVLVADDHPCFQAFAREVLTPVARDVQVVGDGQAAVLAFERALERGLPYQLLIIDLHMPKRNGRQALQAIRQLEFEHECVPAYALVWTGDTLSPLQSPTLGGFDRVMIKPIWPEHLLEVLQDLLHHPCDPPEPSAEVISHASDASWLALPVGSALRETIHPVPDVTLSLDRPLPPRGVLDTFLGKKDNHLPFLYCTVGNDGFFRWVHPKLATILGYSVEEMLERPIMAFLHPEDAKRTAQAIDESTRVKPQAFFVNRYLARDGSLHWIAWWGNWDLKRSVGVAFFREITQDQATLALTAKINRQAEVIERQARAVKAHANTLVGVVQTVSHDVRNCLFGLMGDLDQLKEISVTLAPEPRAVLRAALAEQDAVVTSMSESISQLLDSQRLLVGKVKTPDAVFDMRRLVEDVIRGLAQAQRRYRVVFQLRLPEVASRAYLSFGAVAVLKEALMFCLYRIMRRAQKGRYPLRLTVTDEGFGLLGAYPLCAEPAERGSMLAEDAEGSYALLLHVLGVRLEQVQARIEGMGGRLTVGLDGECERMELRLPRAALPKDAELAMNQAGQAPVLAPVLPMPANLRPFQGLVVDDTLTVRYFLRRQLKALGVGNVAMFDGGSACLAHLASLPSVPYAFALIDLHMPGMDGQEVAVRLKALDRGMVLVAITGDAPDGIAPEIRRCFQAVLQKPFTQTQLQATLVRLLLHPETPRLAPLARGLAPVINH